MADFLKPGLGPFIDSLTQTWQDDLYDYDSVPRPDKGPLIFSPHDFLSITQFIFYVPMVITAIVLVIRNGRIRPRMTLWPLIPFTLVRLAGGPILIALQKNMHEDGSLHAGLLTSAVILLHLGAVLLFVADLDLTRLVLLDKFGDGPFTSAIIIVLRLLLFGAACLLGAGGGIGSGEHLAFHIIGQILTLVGYIIFALDFLILTSVQVYCYYRKAILLPTAHRVLRGALLASPFILVRIIYGIVEARRFDDRAIIWLPIYDNPETSSIIMFFFMALAMEYIALVVYLWSGFSIPRDGTEAEATG
ncbi:hypothetical protein C2857_002848 [Epichloe festucae Fl1]|uniref:DUF7702 domain-containing protein n=1 Tax=Epichloe festucae (strain Fl1) TaxID=877507 RepID=A0A7U3Q0A1_EPIFF|nr:hypothetical protein C2857_002848 [Epichloe festucae Fl1]